MPWWRCDLRQIDEHWNRYYFEKPTLIGIRNLKKLQSWILSSLFKIIICAGLIAFTSQILILITIYDVTAGLVRIVGEALGCGYILFRLFLWGAGIALVIWLFGAIFG